MSTPLLPRNITAASVTYRWTCAKCGIVELARREMNRGDALFLPTMPDGWVQLGTDFPRFYCPAHIVLVLVDGEPVEL